MPCRVWSLTIVSERFLLFIYFFMYVQSLYFYFFSILFFSFIFISWRLITLQYCSGFCHTLIWISHGFTCVPHPDPPSRLPPQRIPLGLPSAPALSTCLMQERFILNLIFGLWHMMLTTRVYKTYGHSKNNNKADVHINSFQIRKRDIRTVCSCASTFTSLQKRKPLFHSLQS